MEMFYYLVFGGLGAVVAALELSKSSKDRTNTSAPFNSFKNNYLLVYSLMMGMLPYCNPTQPRNTIPTHTNIISPWICFKTFNVCFYLYVCMIMCLCVCGFAEFRSDLISVDWKMHFLGFCFVFRIWLRCFIYLFFFFFLDCFWKQKD
jgi:hypothetical protein